MIRTEAIHPETGRLKAALSLAVAFVLGFALPAPIRFRRPKP